MTTSAAYGLAQKLYVAYYGRPADTSGRQYWADRIDAEGVSNDVINSFGNSAEAQGLYNSDVAGNLTIAYWLMLNRAPDQGGLDYWVNQINTGQYSFAGAVWAIASGVTGADGNTMNGKTSTAAIFTSALYTAQGNYGTFYTTDRQAQIARDWMTWYGPECGR
jgi:hypothetical protein